MTWTIEQLYKLILITVLILLIKVLIGEVISVFKKDSLIIYDKASIKKSYIVSVNTVEKTVVINLKNNSRFTLHFNSKEEALYYFNKTFK